MIVARALAISVIWATVLCIIGAALDFSWFGLGCTFLLSVSLSFMFVTGRFVGFKE